MIPVESTASGSVMKIAVTGWIRKPVTVNSVLPACLPAPTPSVLPAHPLPHTGCHADTDRPAPCLHVSLETGVPPHHSAVLSSEGLLYSGFDIKATHISRRNPVQVTVYPDLCRSAPAPPPPDLLDCLRVQYTGG